jgi:hypothetical protein
MLPFAIAEPGDEGSGYLFGADGTANGFVAMTAKLLQRAFRFAWR